MTIGAGLGCAYGRPAPPAATTVLANPYFALTVMAKADRRWIDPVEIQRALSNPVRRERQSDGRMRYWAYVPRLRTYIRVVTLADGYTVHNVFKDSDFGE
jgi:hypothetical protein